PLPTSAAVHPVFPHGKVSVVHQDAGDRPAVPDGGDQIGHRGGKSAVPRQRHHLTAVVHPFGRHRRRQRKSQGPPPARQKDLLIFGLENPVEPQGWSPVSSAITASSSTTFAKAAITCCGARGTAR